MNRGDVLGPYEIIAQIGVGSMGEVYRARDTRLGRDIARSMRSLRGAAAPTPLPPHVPVRTKRRFSVAARKAMEGRPGRARHARSRSLSTF